MSQIIKSVAIFGSADVADDTLLYHDAYTVARHLAQRGYKIVNGGGPGVMEAATQGAESAQGETLTVSFIPKDATFFEGGSSENKADVDIRVDDYVKRLNGLVNNSDAFVIFQGGTGTLSEWAMVWLLAHIYYGQHKPFILYGSFWKEVMDVITRNFFIGKLERLTYRIVTTPEEVEQVLLEFETILQHLKLQSPRAIREEFKHAEGLEESRVVPTTIEVPNDVSQASYVAGEPYIPTPTMPPVVSTSPFSTLPSFEPTVVSEPLSTPAMQPPSKSSVGSFSPGLDRLRALLQMRREVDPPDFFDRVTPTASSTLDFREQDLVFEPTPSLPFGEPNV